MEWAQTRGIALSHIQPGKPQQNACVERYHRTVRHEWLELYIIESIEEAQEFVTQGPSTYNNERLGMPIWPSAARTKTEIGRLNLLQSRVKTGGLT